METPLDTHLNGCRAVPSHEVVLELERQAAMPRMAGSVDLETKLEKDLKAELGRVRCEWTDSEEAAVRAEKRIRDLELVLHNAREACGHFQEMAGSNVELSAALTFIEARLAKAEV